MDARGLLAWTTMFEAEKIAFVRDTVGLIAGPLAKRLCGPKVPMTLLVRRQLQSRRPAVSMSMEAAGQLG